jgi:hypothetical protein
VPNEFRFLVLCRQPTRDGGIITLGDIVNNVHVPEADFPADVRVFAVVGAVLREPMWGKPLDLMAWQLGREGAAGGACQVPRHAARHAARERAGCVAVPRQRADHNARRLRL